MKRKKPVRLDEVAEQEVSEARGWYESKRRGLGDEMLGCLAEALESIERHPEAAHRVEGYENANVRSAPMERFPYRIIYVLLRDRCRVVAFVHDHRGPDYLRLRLKDVSD